MRQLPKFGQDLEEAQRRIAKILDRGPSGRVRSATAPNDTDAGDDPATSSAGDKTQDLVPPDTEVVGGDVVLDGRARGYQWPLTIGSYVTTASVVNVDPNTDQLRYPPHLDVLVEMRVSGTVLARLTFSEPLAFGSELAKSTRLAISSGAAGGTVVDIGIINRSGYAVRIGFQFKRELEL